MLIQRVLTVIVLVPLLLGALLCPYTWVFKLFVALGLALALHEFFLLTGHPKRERTFGLALGLLHSLYLLFCPRASQDLLFEGSLLMLALFAFYCFLKKQDLAGIAQRIALTCLALAYVATLGCFLGLLRDLEHGIFWVLILLAMTWMNDTAAYFVGHRFGRHRLAPKISPGKTVEGFVGGLLGSLVGFLVPWFLMDNPVSLPLGILLVLAVGCVGPLGDLSESLIKRSAGVKDSGTLFPGHGGMLDRIDALLFTGPVVYFFAAFLNS